MTDKNPGNVPRELVHFFERKKLRPAWSYRDVWGDEHRLAFTAAKVMEEDLLADIRDAVVRAQNEGVPFAAFRKELEPVLAAKGWWGQLGLEGENKDAARSRRLQTIYDTNLRQARRHGQYERTQRRKRSQPFLRWRLGPSRDHRPEHIAFDGLIYPVDHVFWKTHFPPTAYGCKCWVESLTRRQAEALGGPSPELDKRLFPDQTYRDPRSGKKRTVPYGVDPGFEFTPGISGRTAGVRQALKKAVEKP